MGLPLDTAAKWLAARRSDIDPAGRAFIEASTGVDRAVTRRWQWLQGAVGVLLVCIIGKLLARMYERELREQVFWATTFRGHALKDDDVLARRYCPERPFAGHEGRFRTCVPPCQSPASPKIAFLRYFGMKTT